jgi:hypothetical protein
LLCAVALFAALGGACGLLAVALSKGLFVVEGLFRRPPVGEAWHPILGAAVWASLGLLVPRAMGVGYDVIDDALAGRLALATLVALMVGKLVIWWIALASGTSGGTLAPILLISSCFGALAGELVARWFPGLGLSPSAFALVAMAATFGAAARAPLASIVFVFELTRDNNAILGVHADPLRTTRLREVMRAAPPENEPGDGDPDSIEVDAGATLYAALVQMVEADVEAVTVVEDGKAIGVCTRIDLLAARVNQLGHEQTELGWLARSGRVGRVTP